LHFAILEAESDIQNRSGHPGLQSQLPRPYPNFGNPEYAPKRGSPLRRLWSVVKPQHCGVRNN
jgi:hypothetical protein